MRMLRRAIRNAHSESRRDFLRNAALTSVAVGLPPIISSCSKPQHALPAGSVPRIAIVGAGIAGLHAAYTLHQSGVRADVYEASNRTGGRMMSAHNLIIQGATTELGGELIDSSHSDMLSLAQQFNLELVDLESEPYNALHETYYFEGRTYSEADIVREIIPVLAHIRDESEESVGIARSTFDKQSIASYFGHLGLTGWLRSFLEVAFITENGTDLEEQSALNFLSTVGSEISNDVFNVYGMSDERYKIKGGVQQITDKLSNAVADTIHHGHALERIERRATKYVLSFRKDNSVIDVTADIVVLALPFSVLREVDVRIDALPHSVHDMISTLKYGNNGKIVVGFPRPFWHDEQHSGSIFSDLPLQMAWDNAALQGVEGGGLTFFSGGSLCRVIGSMSKQKAADMLLEHLHTIWPTSRDVQPGRIERIHWPEMKWARGSYSTFAPGQWTKFEGLLSQPHINATLHFAGEHCSDAQRGFMNGAAMTGRQAAENILAAMD